MRAQAAAAPVVHAERLPSFRAQVPSAPLAAAEGYYADPSTMLVPLAMAVAVPLHPEDPGGLIAYNKN